MKAKLILGPMTGFVEVPGVAYGAEYRIPIQMPLNAELVRQHGGYEVVSHVKQLVFRCHRFDDDRCAIFTFEGLA